MRYIRSGLCYFLFLACVWLAGYEVPAKMPVLLGQSLPGDREAVLAEIHTPWNPRLGIGLADHVVHEVEEAVRYYDLLLSRPAPLPLVSLLQTGQ